MPNGKAKLTIDYAFLPCLDDICFFRSFAKVSANWNELNPTEKRKKRKKQKCRSLEKSSELSVLLLFPYR